MSWRIAFCGANHTPILSERHALILNPSCAWNIDLHRFEELIARAGDDIARLEEAVQLYRGEPLVEQRYEDWATPIQGRRQEAERDFAAVVERAAAMPYPYTRARAPCYCGIMSARSASPDVCCEWLREAIEVFRRLGAQPYVDLTEVAPPASAGASRERTDVYG